MREQTHQAAEFPIADSARANEDSSAMVDPLMTTRYERGQRARRGRISGGSGRLRPGCITSPVRVPVMGSRRPEAGCPPGSSALR
jgi:hypothetical protein